MLALEKVPRTRERASKKLKASTIAGATILSVVPYLRQTLDRDKTSDTLTEHIPNFNTNCAYYAAYLVHVLQIVTYTFPLKTVALPFSLNALVDRNEFCKFFKILLECEPITESSLSNLEPDGILSRLKQSPFWKSKQLPILMAVPIFTRAESDASVIELQQTQWPSLGDDVTCVREFRAAAPGAMIPIMLSNATVNGDSELEGADHWIGCCLYKETKDKLVVVCADSYNKEPDKYLLEELVKYVQQ